MKKRLAIAGVALSGLLLMSSALPAAADSNSKAIAELAAMSPGLSVAELELSLMDYADENGLTLDEAAKKALAEGRQSVAEAAPVTSASPMPAGVAVAASGSIARNINLGSAKYRGDVFVAPAGYGFVQHGHTGIYYSTVTIVEAPGKDKKSRSVASSNYKVGKGAVKQYVKTTAAGRSSAANHANSKLKNKAYNMNFAINKSATGKDMNCSQLVWAAYKASSSRFDLDGNGGLGVYPYDIKNSSKTVTYKTF